jgi:NADPH:quinone reductase-like Zn-dependent oxidoreductase
MYILPPSPFPRRAGTNREINHRSGLTVLTTCSPHNFDLVKYYGADAVFDYSDPEVGKKVRSASNDEVKHVYDTISTASSARIAADAMSSAGGKYTSILAVEFPRDDCEEELIMGYTINGEPFKMGPEGDLNAARPEDFEFGAKFWTVAEELLAQGKLKPVKLTVGLGGLNGVLEGMQLMREGKVSGTKLVYRIADTV